MTKKRSILNFAVFIFVIISSVNLFSLEYRWYQEFFWFDMPMHFLGGLASFLLLVYLMHEKCANHHFHKSFLVKILFLALAVGVAWEVYEYLAQIIISHDRWNYVDTLSDLLFDTIGGILGLLLIKK